MLDLLKPLHFLQAAKLGYPCFPLTAPPEKTIHASLLDGVVRLYFFDHGGLREVRVQLF